MRKLKISRNQDLKNVHNTIKIHINERKEIKPNDGTGNRIPRERLELKLVVISLLNMTNLVLKRGEESLIKL